MKKWYMVPSLLLYLSIVCFINVLSLISTDMEYSSFENRTMTFLPHPRWNTIMTGEWFYDFETYHLDQIVGRKQMIESDSRFQYLLGKREINEIVVGRDHYLLKLQEDYTDNQKITSNDFCEKQLKTLQLIKSYTDTYGGEVYYLDIPSQGQFLWDKYVYPQQKIYFRDQELCKIRKKRYEDAGIPAIMTSDVLNEHRDEQLFYHTDHHYTFLGAYYVYKEMLSAIATKHPEYDIFYPEWDEMESVMSDKRFVGSYIHKIGDTRYEKYDKLQYSLPSDCPQYKRYESGDLSDRPLVRDENEYEFTEYGYFMDGDNAQTVIKTDRPELPSILFIGYSFTNPLELMSVYTFDQVHSIDPRDYEGSICQYIKENQCDIVVVVGNDIYEGNAQDCARFRE